MPAHRHTKSLTTKIEKKTYYYVLFPLNFIIQDIFYNI